MAYGFTALDFNDETFASMFGYTSPFNLGPTGYHLTTETSPFLPFEFPWGFQQTLETDIAPGVGTAVLARGSVETDRMDYTAPPPLRGPEHPLNHNHAGPSAPRQFRCLDPGCSRLGWARPEHLRRHISMYGALLLFVYGF
ncbi:hypothetical protein GGR55DRAFT_554514 [Xylaria sp. FL0064]|nr:hypothetical protein GGR55DRAFT_554514 [Xylaria sp. FL0064]